LIRIGSSLKRENHKPIRIAEDEKIKSKNKEENKKKKNKLLLWWRRRRFAGRFAKVSVFDLLGQWGSAFMRATVSSRYVATHFRRQRWRLGSSSSPSPSVTTAPVSVSVSATFLLLFLRSKMLFFLKKKNQEVNKRTWFGFCFYCKNRTNFDRELWFVCVHLSLVLFFKEKKVFSWKALFFSSCINY